MPSLPDQLRAARTARGASLETVSQEAKISPAYLHKLEAGRVRDPSPRVLARLADALHISYASLMEGIGYLLPGQAGREPAAGALTTDPAGGPPAEAATNADIVALLQRVLDEVSALRRAHEALLDR